MTKKISCLIVDDEPNASALLERYVVQVPFLELVCQFSNGMEVIDFFTRKSVDLIFLDIQMPGLTGIELSRIIPSETKIIFTTAFDQYALEGFKVEALDYLLKPFNFEEFMKAVMKANNWFSLIQNQPAGESKETEEQANSKKFLFVKSEYKQIKIQFNEIELIEGLKDYVKIWLKENPKPILTLTSLKKLEEELPSNKFMRVHRSFIISLDKIETIERNQILIRNKRITVSKQYKAGFHVFIENNSL